MLAPDSILCRANEEIVAKVMDGEAVIINLECGTYYSADGVGGVVWELIESGARLSDIAREIEARYEVVAANALEDILSFVADLVKEGLVAGGVETEAPRVAAAAVESRLPYQPPRLHVYRDMEQLLALDPPTPGLADLRWKG